MVNWDEKFASRVNFMQRSSIREILKLTQQPEMISFAGGLPSPDVFPIERIREAADVVLAERGREAMQYSASEGMPELRDFIAERASTATFTVKRENVIILNGAQQAVDLIGRVMLDDGDKVLVENPTYLGTLNAWRAYNLHYLTIPTDADGLLVDQVEAVLQQNPKLMYLIPNFQNPQGVTLSEARRAQLVQLLAEYGAIAIEDDPYGALRYSGEPVPSLMEMDARNMGTGELGGQVAYCGTFSKVLTPGMRLGWLIAPEPLIERVLQAKQGSDLHTSTFTQLVAYEVIRTGFLEEQIQRIREVYRERRDLMLAALDKYFPAEARWTQPEGGLFLMVTVPEQIDALELLNKAIKHNVAFVPGADFHVGGTGKNTFRLNFSNAQLPMIEEGVKRLGNLLKEALAEQPTG